MLMVISPAKSLDFTAAKEVLPLTTPALKAQIVELAKVTRKLTVADLKRLMPGDATATLALLLDYVPGREGQEVADPYFGGAEGFAMTWADVTEAARHLVRRLL